MTHVASDLIDLECYPIDRACDARDALIESVRADLARDGCAVIKGFLTPEGIEALRREADRVADKGYRSFNRTNA